MPEISQYTPVTNMGPDDYFLIDKYPITPSSTSIIQKQYLAASSSSIGMDRQIVYNVMNYGATGNGVTNDAPSIQAAINLAAVSGGIVFFPVGIYAIGAPLNHTSGAAIIFKGTNRINTQLIGITGSNNLLNISVDYDVVEGLTLDTQTNNKDAAINLVANYTTLRDCIIKGGNRIFALFYAGPSNATAAHPVYNYGNVVENVIVNDNYNGDGFSWSLQSGWTIKNITHTGSRIAIYFCGPGEIDGYYYTPGTQNAVSGWYITSPANGITIRNWFSSGSGGVISQNPDYLATNIILENHYLTGSGSNAGFLNIGDVNGLTISNFQYTNNNSIVIEPLVGATNITIANSTIPQISPQAGATIPITNVYMDNCYFPNFTTTNQNPYTFANFNGSPFNVSIMGGRFDNTTGLIYGSGTYKILNLDNYNPIIEHSLGNVSGATTFNRLNGHHQIATLTGNITATITSGKITGDQLTLELTQDGTGSRTITWPSNFKKAGGTMVLSTGANATDIVSMIWDGTNWKETNRALNVS